jgi:hypothetical protein
MSSLRSLFSALAKGDAARARRLLADAPSLAREAEPVGASRAAPRVYFFDEIGHYVYKGDTALHVAAAGYRVELARELLSIGANPAAANRRGAQPLHYAADGGPGSPQWNPPAQTKVIACLIDAGADPNAADKDGVTPLHRAVRTRCAAAVKALLARGADPRRRNKGGSTPPDLAGMTTGRGGSGTAAAKEQQREILKLFGSR